MKASSTKQGAAGGGRGGALTVCLAVVMCLAFTRAFAGSQPESTIIVRVYNYAHVQGGALTRAKSEAQRILATAGVESLWLDCSLVPTQFQSRADQVCAGPFGGRTLVVRILPGSTPAKAAFRDTVFGFAEGDSVASVFCGRITELAPWLDNADGEIPLVMGAVIAHELGHLLLRSNSHSPTGVMCGQWDRNCLRLAIIGRQLFTPQQAEVIRAEVARRDHIEVAEQLARPQEAALPDALDTRPDRKSVV